MERMQLFLNINKPGLNNAWNEKINSSLKEYNAIENVQVIEQNESDLAKINLDYDIEKTTFDEIELLIKNSGATITEINIHFPSGTTSPYGAAAIAISVDEQLNTIKGILKSGISPNGEIKFLLDAGIDNKQAVIEEAIKRILSIR